jgi:3-hydroxyacyl-[acyl-carrier-protein] dehydratase
MLENDLFFITATEKAEGSIFAELRINAAHRLFAGHFPDSPVTPGVIQLQMVKSVLEKHFDKKLQLKTVRTCKFLQVLNPDNTPFIKLNLKYKLLDTIEVTASGEHDGTTFFKAQATYQ